MDNDDIFDDEELEPKKKTVSKPDKSSYYVDPQRFKKAISDFYDTDICPDYLGECLNKIAEGLGYNAKFINYCVDADTEALTNRGWLTHDKITAEDKILAYDVNTKGLVWSGIKNIFNGTYNGLMYSLNNSHLDALVTPNHKFVSVENGIKPIEEFTADDNLVVSGDFFTDIFKYKTCSFGEFLVEGKLPTVQYDGVIWCPQTEYGTWLCRRNGKIYVTGNSYKEEMIGDALIKMFSALKRKKFDVTTDTSPFGYFTTIAFHAFINRIKKEKKHHDTLVEYKEKKYEEEMAESGSHIYVKPIRDNTGDTGLE